MKRIIHYHSESHQLIAKLFVTLNIILYRLTNGAVGSSMGGALLLLLTTTGRKTGKQRTTPLRYFPHEDGYIVVASNYGKEKPPAWFFNIQANPNVKIQVVNKHMNARAEIASDARQPALYQRFIDADPRFIEYAQTAKRTIAVIILHPQP
ncbi:MAG: nitroreductase family deazaflavin-dependent oxidoreductase [Chloroflexi bacterium]|nr:nitroreductase family deazaflavin-dependent oxidoreductase [Chloroflexota bacterium]